ncbi:MAG: 50S ribosomal protein L25 [Candidatus Melainabacteria bacterium]|nr:50S ribosomal protein L25 [Candidatus Melainabacteria bacterium]
MAKQLTIKAKPREDKKPNALRALGYVPATIYGHGFSSESVQVNAKDFSKIPHKAYSHINQLDVEGKEKYPVLIRNVQVDPVKDNYLNIEFYRIKSDEKIKVKVAINYMGHSPAVVVGGVLIVSLSELEIQCLPNDIPDAIDADLGQILEIGQSIQVKDLKVSDKINLLHRKEEVLAKVEIPKTHEVEEEKAPTVAEGIVAAAPVEGAQAVPVAGSKEAPAAGKQAPTAGKQAPAAAKQAAPQAGKAPDAKPAKK